MSHKALCQIAELLHDQITSLHAQPKDHLTQKLAALGVYDLQTLKLAIAVIHNEAGSPIRCDSLFVWESDLQRSPAQVVDTEEIQSSTSGRYSGSRITSKSLAVKAKAKPKSESIVQTENSKEQGKEEAGAARGSKERMGRQRGRKAELKDGES